MSWKLTTNRFFKSRQVIFCNRQKVSVLGEICEYFSTFGDFYIDVEWLKTSVVCSKHKRSILMSWKLTMNRLFQARLVILCNRQKVSVLGEFVNIFYIWRLLHWCWVTQHICCLFLALDDILVSWKLTMNRLFSQDRLFFVLQTKSESTGWICENFPLLATSTLTLNDSTHL